MKTVYVSLLVAILVVFAISVDAQIGASFECPKYCTFDYKPVCGYDGVCYRKYGNECTLKVDRCSSDKKKDVKAVDMESCEQALAKSNPDVFACADE